ncbi:small secreted protein [Streptomyces sp. PTM05]|uniref:Small secreted protein n=1 Tax=Streptantibioticus parmotrematis TaxID=2873249 RepID=A0ABS7QZ59_9ACTN|nr:small secreted protein [Streptantibioticus parmotrematis]
MNKRLAAALCCAATATLALAGCGSSDNKTDDYAKSVCDQVQPQRQKIQNADNDIASVSSSGASPSQVQSTDSTAFGQISDAYKALASGIQDAGAPPVGNGAALQKNAVDQLNAISGAYADLKKKVGGLDASDQAKFAQGLGSIPNQVTTLSKNGDDALAKLQADGIGQAMAKQPGCQKATTAPTLAPSPDASGSGGPGASTAPSGSAKPSGSTKPSASSSTSVKPSSSASSQS